MMRGMDAGANRVRPRLAGRLMRVGLERWAGVLALVSAALLVGNLLYSVLEGVSCSFHPPCNETPTLGLSSVSTISYVVAGIMFALTGAWRRAIVVALPGVAASVLLSVSDSTRIIVVSSYLAVGLTAGVALGGWFSGRE